MLCAEKMELEDSLADIGKRTVAYKQDIRKYIDTVNAMGEQVVRLEYTKTVYENDNMAYIERIQYTRTGRKYYFKQDFLLEDGVWKIKGDNITDPFRLKRRFLF